MSQKAKIYCFNKYAGMLEERDDGKYIFSYDQKYLQGKNPKAVSLTLPLTETPYEAEALFPFFDGLIPEGWLLNIAVKNWKIDPRNRMGLLLNTCSDCIGAVHVEPLETERKK